MVEADATGGLSEWVPVRVDAGDLQQVAIDWDGVRAAERRRADLARLQR